ncbi:Isochorismatase family protein [Aquisphaera giovannonii]|uniref:Isochorismatase family protein n=1 Tax=Aquisphaera giovannonii TaxID=406548 RepID=A0A5B9W9L7_9BACT|nr:isochorismatase family protein [Aquisphaera giovannonii]QEH36771.1 Isochorismatase family protein [Aquisphaera giovannonii]
MRVTERLTARHGALLVVDMQEKLLAAIPDGDAVTANAGRLARGAAMLGMPTWATEQYPKGLGPTVAPIVEQIPERHSKMTFHCCAVPWLVEQLYSRHIRHVTLAGVEAHVCVAQTALELLDMGFRVQVPADAVASRKKFDWEFCLRRLEHAGATVSTTEAVLFEWLGTADRPEFKEFSRMVKEAGPTAQ